MDLSLKYRPKFFSEVSGQFYIVQSIQNAIKYNDVAPLYLFSGVQGVGKTTIARLIAMSLCCQNFNNDEPCGQCDNCKSIISGNYFADVHEINAAQFTRKGDADSLIFDTINYQPMIAKKKIYILDECHQLSKAAQQSLLKIFEEPPKDTIFILCTTEIDKVLSTIVDRSIHYEFKRISTKNIYNRISNICKIENVDIDDESLWLIAKESNGSMRKPFKILNTIGIHDKITLEKIESIIGTTNTQISIDFLNMIINNNRYDIIKLLDNVISNGKSIESVFLETMECLIDILKIKMYKENCIINRSDSVISELENISKKFKRGENIINVLNSLDSGIKQLHSSFASDSVIAVLIALDAIKEFNKINS